MKILNCLVNNLSYKLYLGVLSVIKCLRNALFDSHKKSFFSSMIIREK